MANSAGTRAGWMAVNVSRFLLSLTFLFSGSVKLVDPMGTAYKIEEYARVLLGLSFEGWMFMPVVLAAVLALIEFNLGVCLFFGVHRWRSARFSAVFVLCMTILTGYVAATNAISDCGCFGDALKLTPWQTFGKNVALMLVSAVVAWKPLRMSRLILESNQWMIILYTRAFAFVFLCINLYGLPAIDFRPYYIGSDLLEKMSGSEAEMPQIADFQMLRVEDGDDITLDFLQQAGYKFLLIAPRLENASEATMDATAEIYDYACAHGYPFYCLTSSGDEEIARWRMETGAEYPYCRADEMVLQTVIRSNPGLVLLEDGVVRNKWPHTSLPQLAAGDAPIEAQPWLTMAEESDVARLLRILLYYIVPLLAITAADRLWTAIKWKKAQKQQQ